MSKDLTFEVREEHLKLIKKFSLTWCNAEFGAPMVSPKRPYGNSYVYGDMADILEIKGEKEEDGELILSSKQERELLKLHKETLIALQVLLENGTFKTGIYTVTEYSNVWCVLIEIDKKQ